jgi:hypothetical protein
LSELGRKEGRKEGRRIDTRLITERKKRNER